MSAESPRCFAYSPPRRAVVALAFSCALSVILACIGWGVTDVIPGCLAASGAMFGFMALIALTRRVFLRELVLTEDAVVFPQLAILRRMTRIPYADIIRVRERAASGLLGECLFIVTDRACSLLLPGFRAHRALPHLDSLDECHSASSSHQDQPPRTRHHSTLRVAVR